MRMGKVCLRLVVGLLQGAILAFLYSAASGKIWPATNPSLFYPVVFLSVFIPFVISLSMNVRPRVQMLGVCCVALVLAGIGYYAIFRELLPPQLPVFSFFSLFFATAISLIIALSLGISADHDNKWVASYPTYFDVAWKIVIQLCFSGAFVLGLWAILGLGSALFSMIGIKLFYEMITQPWFAFPVTTLAISYALYMTDVNSRIVNSIRNLFLTLFSALLPLITTIVALFLIGFIFVNLRQVGSVNGIAMLSIQSAMLIIVLINAAYQDGLKALSGFLGVFTKIACHLLLILVGLAIYGLTVRVQQYGWTAYRIQGAFLIAILSWYAIGYVITAWFGVGLKKIEISNILASYLLLLVYLMLYTPIADPDRLAVAAQMADFISGKTKPADFDVEMLKRQGTRFSQAALERLQGYHNSMGLMVGNMKGLWVESKLRRQERRSDYFVVHTQQHRLPVSFLDQDWQPIRKQIEGMNRVVPQCFRDNTPVCHAWVVRQNNHPMILVLSYSEMLALMQDSVGIWKIVGGWNVSADDEKLIRDNQFEMVPPPMVFPELKVGQTQMPFNPVYK